MALLPLAAFTISGASKMFSQFFQQHTTPFQHPFCPAFAFISLALRDCGRISALSGLYLTNSFSVDFLLFVSDKKPC
jgi:hypothetical protein